MGLVALPEGFKWDIRKSTAGGYLLVLLPADGYTWDFPLSNPYSEPTMAFYYAKVKNPKDKEQLYAAAREVLSVSLGPTTVIKPKVRRKDL